MKRFSALLRRRREQVAKLEAQQPKIVNLLSLLDAMKKELMP